MSIEPHLVAVFGPIGAGLAIAFWIGWTLWKILRHFDVEVNHNGGSSLKDMMHDQREYSKNQSEYLREVLSTQREVKELLREEHKSADMYRAWAQTEAQAQADILADLVHEDSGS